MADQVPSIGRVLHYTVSKSDAEKINKRRQESPTYMDEAGNEVKAGNVYPLIITAVWGDQPTSAFSGRVFLDGNDLFWVTSTSVGEGPAKCQWPPYVPPK